MRPFERREPSKSLSKPEPGSKLAFYVRHLETLTAFDEREFRAATEGKRCATILGELGRASIIADLPRAVVAEFFVVFPLLEIGMPDERPFPPWLDFLIETATSDFLHRQGKDPVPRLAGQTPTKAAHTKSLAEQIILAAYVGVLQAGGGTSKKLTDNAAYEAVAARLGGIDRGHVRRVVRPFRRTLARMTDKHRNLQLLGLMATNDSLREADDGVRKQRRVLPFQRTRPAETMRP